MLFIAKDMYDNNHKSVYVREDFEKYSSMHWEDKASEKWSSLEKIYNILKTIAIPIESITFEFWKISSALFIASVIFKYRNEIAEL